MPRKRKCIRFIARCLSAPGASPHKRCRDRRGPSAAASSSSSPCAPSRGSPRGEARGEGEPRGLRSWRSASARDVSEDCVCGVWVREIGGHRAWERRHREKAGSPVASKHDCSTQTVGACAPRKLPARTSEKIRSVASTAGGCLRFCGAARLPAIHPCVRHARCAETGRRPQRRSRAGWAGQLRARTAVGTGGDRGGRHLEACAAILCRLLEV